MGCGISPRFHLAVFAIGVNQEKWEAGRAQDYQHNVGTVLRRPSSSYKLLESRIQNSCI